jgi:hypothetical protein
MDHESMREEGIYLSLVRSKKASDVGIVVGGVFFRATNERWTLAAKDQWERREFQFTSRWWGARKRAM